MTAEIRRRTGAAWSTFRRYANVVYDRPTAIVPMVLKVRMLQEEVREALLYGCSTWSLLTREYSLLRTQHYRLLLRYVGFRKGQRSDHPLSLAATLAMTGCESVEATIRRRRLLFAGFLLLQQLDRLPRALLQGSLVNGSNRPVSYTHLTLPTTSRV